MPNAIPGTMNASYSTARAPGALPTNALPNPGPAQGVNQGGTVGGSTGRGLLRLVSGSELDRQDQARREQQEGTANYRTPPVPDIGAYIRNLWTIFRNNRNQGQDPLNQRLLRAQRMFEGKYDPEKLGQINQFGGSIVYSRLGATKCRSATSMLRSIYLSPERPWDIEPQPDPDVPPDVMASIAKLVSVEVANAQQAGQPLTSSAIQMRKVELERAAQQAARENAMEQSKSASDKIEDILVAGKFYEALGQFLTDLPIFPFACLKGPVVRMTTTMQWQGNTPRMVRVPQMFWERISPFDIYWSPGASHVDKCDMLERKRFTRKDLNDLIGLPGYDEQAIRGALQDYARGLREWLDAPDTEQAFNEGREDPNWNQSQYIDGLEFNGWVQGYDLINYGMDASLVPDLDKDYLVQSWIVGRYTIKTQLNPSPRNRHPYYLTSYEKVPGTVHGHSVLDLIEDFQEICNATLRSMVNNMALSSGPQVVINDEVVSPGEDSDEMFPWKRWHITEDPMGTQKPPITFFQPQSNAQELMAVYNQVSGLADDVSAIPRFMTGSAAGGAGRTSSGLQQLQANGQALMQTVASNVDMDVMEPSLEALYDLIMLTDQSGLLTGEEQIRVRGVNVAVQRDTERQKQLQFLQITGNPIDAPIVGKIGRAKVLRAVASGLGLPDDIVPTDHDLQQQQQAEQQMAAQQAAGQGQGQGQGGPPPPPPGSPGTPGGTNIATAPNPAAAAQGAQAPAAPPASLADNVANANSHSPIPGVMP